MNEISNFVTGSVTGCPSGSSLENPPYLPGECAQCPYVNLTHEEKQNLYAIYYVY